MSPTAVLETVTSSLTASRVLGSALSEYITPLMTVDVEVTHIRAVSFVSVPLLAGTAELTASLSAVILFWLDPSSVFPNVAISS